MEQRFNDLLLILPELIVAKNLFQGSKKGVGHIHLQPLENNCHIG